MKFSVTPNSFRCSPEWFELGSRRFPIRSNSTRQTTARADRRSGTNGRSVVLGKKSSLNGAPLPKVIARALELFGAYGWDPWEVLPGVLAILGAALGPSVVLEVPGLDASVVPFFHAGIWRAHSQGIAAAMELLIQGVCRAAKLATSALSQKERENQIQAIKSERDDFFAFEPVRDPLTQSEFETQIRELEQERPGLRVMESPRGSQLRKWLQRAWSPTLVYYSGSGFERLLNKGTSRWLADCELIIHSKLSSVSFCGTESLGRLLSIENPWAEQFLLARSSGKAKGPPRPIDRGFIVAFCSLIQELVERGQSECPRTVHLSADVNQLFLTLPFVTRQLVAKLALFFYRCEDRTGSELETSSLAAALPIARELLGRSAEVSRLLRQRLDKTLAQRKETEMLQRIKKAGTVRRRDLLRSFHSQDQGKHSPAIQAVLTSGRVDQSVNHRSTWLSYHER